MRGHEQACGKNILSVERSSGSRKAAVCCRKCWPPAKNGRGHCVCLAFFSTALDEFAALGVQVLQVSCIVAEGPVAVTANGCDCISAPQQSEFGNSKARSRTCRSSRSISRSPFWWTAALLSQDSTVPAGVRVERVKANLDMTCVGKFGGMSSCNQMPQESARRSPP